MVATRSLAVSLIHYSRTFIARRSEELRDMDRRTRKVMTMNGALPPRANTSRLSAGKNGG